MNNTEVSRYFYQLAYSYIRRMNRIWSYPQDWQSIRAIPVHYRRAAARSYNANRHETESS